MFQPKNSPSDTARPEGQKPKSAPSYCGSGKSFGTAAAIVGIIAALIEMVTVSGMWYSVFPSVAAAPWFTVLVGHLPAGVLLVGVAFAWTSTNMDSKIWTRPGAWIIGLLGYGAYLFLAEVVIGPLSGFLANFIPAQYTAVAATLVFWAVMVLAIAKCIGRFVLHVAVGLSPNVIVVGIIVILVLVIISGAAPAAFHDFIYASLPPEIADKLMAPLAKAGASMTAANPQAFIAPLTSGNNTITALAAQFLGIIVKYLPQWIVSVLLLHSYVPKAR